MLPSRKENNKQKKKKPNTNLKAHINKEANKNNNNKKQTKKKYKKNHPTINCGARTCDYGLCCRVGWIGLICEVVTPHRQDLAWSSPLTLN